MLTFCSKPAALEQCISVFSITEGFTVYGSVPFSRRNRLISQFSYKVPLSQKFNFKLDLNRSVQLSELNA